MSNHPISIAKYGVIGLLPLVLMGCDSLTKVSYSKDVRPIIDEHCMECHKSGGEGEKKSGMNMETYASLMKGTKFGAMITPGDSFTSNLVILIEGRADPSIYMPRGDHGPLQQAQIDTIKKWIDQGAKEN